MCPVLDRRTLERCGVGPGGRGGAPRARGGGASRPWPRRARGDAGGPVPRPAAAEPMAALALPHPPAAQRLRRGLADTATLTQRDLLPSLQRAPRRRHRRFASGVPAAHHGHVVSFPVKTRSRHRSFHSMCRCPRRAPAKLAA